MKNWIRQHTLAFFFFIAFLFSWAVEICLIASHYGWIPFQLPKALHYLASFGPMIAAMITTIIINGTSGWHQLWSRMTKWQVERKWMLFSLLSPFLFYLVGILVNYLFTNKWPDLSLLGQVNYLPNLGMGAIFLWLVTFGFGEETGWRGFALPELQKKTSALNATIFLGLIWILWHVPTFFYHETYTEMGPFLLMGMSISILLGGVMLTWLYNSTGGSIFLVAVWHALFDFFSASQSNGPWVAPMMSFCIIFLAIRILKIYPKETLSASEKQTG